MRAVRVITAEGYRKYPGEYDDTKGALLERLVDELLEENPGAVTVSLSVERSGPQQERPEHRACRRTS